MYDLFTAHLWSLLDTIPHHSFQIIVFLCNVYSYTLFAVQSRPSSPSKFTAYKANCVLLLCFTQASNMFFISKCRYFKTACFSLGGPIPSK